VVRLFVGWQSQKVRALARFEGSSYQLALGAIGRFDHINSEVELLKHLSHAVSAFGYICVVHVRPTAVDDSLTIAFL
jgi:hypothetical protein